METAISLIGLVVVVAAVSAGARRVRVPAPLLLTLVGISASFLPLVPEVRLSAEVVLIGFLPPLLYATAIRTSLFDFRSNRRTISLLSVGLVLFTAGGVGLVTYWLLPVPLAAALALGAVVAPPDAVAATAIARRVGMPRRIVSILEGESLVNDATALVTLRTAIAALGGALTLPAVALDFVLAAGGGVAVGLLIAYLAAALRMRIHDSVLDTTVSLVLPFCAYLLAEEIHASGVLAVVVTGLILGHRAPIVQTAASRISERTNWRTFQFLLENTVFLLIGLQVRSIVVDVGKSDLGLGQIATACALILITVMVLRPIWVFPATYLPRLIPAVRRTDPPSPWQHPAVVSWAGMRGVVTLATVFVLPPQLPNREVLVLAALVVTAGTLLIQGFTLPSLVRILGLRGPDPREDRLAEAALTQEVVEAGLAELDQLPADDHPVHIIERLRDDSIQRRHTAWERLGPERRESETPSALYARLRLAMLASERERLLELRDAGLYPHEVLAAVMEALDIEESVLEGATTFEDLAPIEVTPIASHHACEHLSQAPVTVVPLTPQGCAECLQQGMSWVHLRLCLSCGAVGCCESSPGQHALAHYRQLGHPVIRSFETGENWRWCYVDAALG